jgi:tetratricopeptide (TPR) repeat protein
MRQVGGEPVLLAQALTQAGLSTTRYREVTEAEQYHDEALTILRQRGRTKRLANALMIAGAMRKDAMDLQAARALVEEALVLSKALGDVRVQDGCETQLAVIAFLAGQLAEAIDRARRAVEASRRHGTLAAELMALQWLAGFLILDDQIEPGRVAARSAFELSRALGVDSRVSFYHLALVLAMNGETDSAARLAGFAAGYATSVSSASTGSAERYEADLLSACTAR